MRPSAIFRGKAVLEVSLTALVFAASLAVNFMSIGGGNRIRAVSNRHMTVLTPAPYTFAIWSVIYLCAICVIGVWFFYAAHDKASFLEQRYARQNLTLLSLLNAFWIFAWVNEWLVGAWVLICLMLGLLILNERIQMRHEYHHRPLLSELTKAFYGLYFGWITVAALLNTLVLLADTPIYRQAGGALAPLLLWPVALFAAWKVLKGNSTYGAAVLWASAGILRQKFTVHDDSLPVWFIFFAIVFLMGVIAFKEISVLKKIRRSGPVVKKT